MWCPRQTVTSRPQHKPPPALTVARATVSRPPMSPLNRAGTFSNPEFGLTKRIGFNGINDFWTITR
jgi:hypothetical protein